MEDGDWLAERFEEHRQHLRSVAHRMLGSLNEADDAVQESWLRLSRSDVMGVENLGGWLTTVVARVCLDMLRSRYSRHEEPMGTDLPDPVIASPEETDPAYEAMLADSVGHALLVVLDTLAPTERLAFVLHDMFAVPYDEIAPIVGRTPTAARQLASRARRRVQRASVPDVDMPCKRKIVDAFLTAARGGDLAELLELLDPDVVLRTDVGATPPGMANVIHGVQAVSEFFTGRARDARRATVNGEAGAVWAPGGRVRVAFDFTIMDGTITGIELVSDPERLGTWELAILDS